MGTVTQLKPLASPKAMPQAPKAEPLHAGRRYKEVRSREYLTDEEMRRVLKAARDWRNGKRNHLMILLAWRHGLRVTELVTLRWDSIDLVECRINISRMKGSKSGEHPLQEDEIRALKAWQRTHRSGIYVFNSEQGAPLTQRGFHMIIAKAGKRAGLSFPIHPHMLRHACGYHLANESYQGRGTDTRTIAEYLGHRNIQNTVRYTDLNTKKFSTLWD